jgi:hypothetical protein
MYVVIAQSFNKGAVLDVRGPFESRIDAEEWAWKQKAKDRDFDVFQVEEADSGRR